MSTSKDIGTSVESWLHIGQTPMEGVLVPANYLRWRVTKEGFAPVEGAFHAHYPVRFALHPSEASPPRMVPVPGGPLRFRDLVGGVGELLA